MAASRSQLWNDYVVPSWLWCILQSRSATLRQERRPPKRDQCRYLFPGLRRLASGTGTCRAYPGTYRTFGLLTVIRTLDLRSLRLKMATFTFVSLIGALSQAGLLLVVSEVVVAGVQGQHRVHARFGPSFSSKTAVIICLVALLLFFSTSILSTFLSSSLSEQALTSTRHTRRHRVLPVQLVPPIH